MSNTVGYSLGCVTPVRYNLTQGEDTTGNGVLFSPSQRCQVLPPIITECKSREGTATLCGHSEFQFASGGVSSPPRKYRTKTVAGSMFDCAWLNLACSGAQAYGARYDYSGECSYSATTCAVENSLNYTEYSGPTCPATTQVLDVPQNCTWGDTISPSSSSCIMTVVVSRTRIDRSGTGVCCNMGDGRATKRTGGMYWELSEEDTESDAEARVPEEWTPWENSEFCVDCCTAFRGARPTGFTFSFKNVNFRLGITEGVEGHLYSVAVDYERRLIGDIEWAVAATEYFTITSQPRPVGTDPNPSVIPGFHDSWEEYEVPQLSGYETRVSNVRHVGA